MRAGGFASVCVVLSQAGHDLMASRPVPPWAGWAALAGVGAVGYLLADRRRPLWWILLAVEVVQGCLHLWFTWSTSTGSGPPLQHPGMVMHGGVHQVVGADVAMAHGGGTSVSMLGAHVLAGALVAVWLYAGERVLWRALGMIAGLLLGCRVFWLFACGGLQEDRWMGGARRRRNDEDEAPPVLAVLRHALVRRGPPWAGGVREHATA